MAAERERGEIPEMVSFAEIARRVSDQGLVSRPITRQGVRHIASTDPQWPIPEDQWQRAGTAIVVPWKPVEQFFREREKRGRGPAAKPESDSDE
ncbi:hypothetical protein HMPREF1486_03125 [Streptomyces sp. HPH0547]|uniref:hypothetical protein n=1 Tax=Streptomyces TaxID=1883 RepID=UPI00034E96B1|nr:hypothetical protein [Streptomyces sp. HPH0547]EPD94572.1 hypothetical protein HMPREF1486_03125 [Streptomyces sp. HPH0547]